MSGNLEGPGSVSGGTDPAIAQMDRLGHRLVRLEQALDQLIETHQALMGTLVAKQNARKQWLVLFSRGTLTIGR